MIKKVLCILPLLLLSGCGKNDKKNIFLFDENDKTKIIGIKDKSVNELVIPDGTTIIGKYAFVDCTKLTNVELPEGVQVIEPYAFCQCYSLMEISIPKSIKKIWDNPFYSCHSLTSIYYNGTSSDWLGMEFYDFLHTRTYNYYFIDDEGTVEYKGKKYSLPTEIITPNSIETIDNGKFYDFKSLEKVDLSNSVATIGDNAFYGCINLKEVILSNNLTSIGSLAFANCDIRDLIIPKSIKTISFRAFNDSNLDKIYYKGTIEEWNNIDIKKWDSSDQIFSATVYYYSENEPAESGNYWHYDTNNKPVVWNLG